jgi:hypothetical protein
MHQRQPTRSATNGSSSSSSSTRQAAVLSRVRPSKANLRANSAISAAKDTQTSQGHKERELLMAYMNSLDPQMKEQFAAYMKSQLEDLPQVTPHYLLL